MLLKYIKENLNEIILPVMIADLANFQIMFIELSYYSLLILDVDIWLKTIIYCILQYLVFLLNSDSIPLI